MRGHFVAVSALALWPALVSAQWTATRLHPEGSHDSAVGGVTADHQYGVWQATSFSFPKPVIWSGTSSFVNLAPGATDGGALAGGIGDTQFGTFNGHASLWQGTPESRVDLNPIGLPGNSDVTSMAGSQQVGDYYTPGVGHAALWSGTAQSFVDLHPAGAQLSIAYATDGVQQGGYVQFVAPHAALWSGTAASMLDLNPIGSSGSHITGMVPGQQVGYATLGTPGIDHAGIWSGSAASWIDLNPPNSYSQLFATCGSAEVGILNGFDAAIWFGTPQSVIDLHSFLPNSYYYSIATSIAEEDGVFYVGGWAEQAAGTREAFLWVGVPSPSTLSLAAPILLTSFRRRRGGVAPTSVPLTSALCTDRGHP